MCRVGGIVLALCLFGVASLEAQSVIRVNCGGSAYTDPAGNYWSADFGFSGPSSAWSSGASIGNTNAQPLYQAQRYTTSSTPLIYTFGVSNGSYGVHAEMGGTCRRLAAAFRCDHQWPPGDQESKRLHFRPERVQYRC
ncbi:MAG: hypothetical protein JST93_22055 [Acidobacteria bacterium]|nr:hypothetical protein [Acidobacteriota bacterium]